VVATRARTRLLKTKVKPPRAKKKSMPVKARTPVRVRVVARAATTAAKAKTLAREKAAVIPRDLAHRKTKRQTPSNLELYL
jgi:hypothetical protein